ncbi:MAG: hypothetical protein K6F46_11710 [Desulfovibrio sp.]|nr:hypothetical protein [Desulfovibrio sp.]
MNEKYREQQRQNAVQMLANDESGRAFLRWMLSVSDLLCSTGVPMDLGRAGFREGRRDIGERILRLIYDAKLPADQLADIFREDKIDV